MTDWSRFMKCMVCKQYGHHEFCQDVEKFRCMCGCERKYSLRYLNRMGLNPHNKIKCVRKQLRCQCRHETNILFRFTIHDSERPNVDDRQLYVCYRCFNQEIEKWEGPKTEAYDKLIVLKREKTVIETRLKRIMHKYNRVVKLKARVEDFNRLMEDMEKHPNRYYNLQEIDTSRRHTMKAEDEEIYKMGLSLVNQYEEYDTLVKDQSKILRECERYSLVDIGLNPFDIITTVTIILKRAKVPSGIIHEILLMCLVDDDRFKISNRYRMKYRG